VRNMGGPIGLSLVIVAGVVLAGCSGSSGASDQPSAQAVAGAGGLGGAPTSATSSAAPSPNVTKKVTEARFQTPSKNIGCALTAEMVRCDIVKKDWTPPPKPADCELDWGFGIIVEKGAKASFNCAGDTVIGAGEVLAYGQSLRAGDFVCDSTSSSLRCSNVTSGHGFALSAQSYDIF